MTQEGYRINKDWALIGFDLLMCTIIIANVSNCHHINGAYVN